MPVGDEQVSEPKMAMDEAELNRLTKQVGRAMVAVAGPRWQKVRAEYRSVGRHVEVDLIVTGADGEPVSVRPPTEMVEGLRTLRGGMYRPGRGTWISAVYEIEPPGDYTVEFEPDVEPTWRRVPPPIGFIDELRFFPREDSHIPNWLRERVTPPGPVPPQGPVPPRPGPPPPGAPMPHPGPPQPNQGPPPPGQPHPGPGHPGQPGPHHPGPQHPGHGQPPGPHQPHPGQPGPWPPGPGQPGPMPPRGPVPPPGGPQGPPAPPQGPPTPPWGTPGQPSPPGWTPPAR
ncbi:hypothetical protein GCM10010171_52220 [Actinokineospora fastidiosa]|uniref:Uncharacterized protein n=1 Tax=Actinokineospora fastidiosa TaxID=1816 RepID=A0A918GPX7_9PSEU|nr:hypothetical protein GCM10010171_52220 [Actinokineospora fastidiosa]